MPNWCYLVIEALFWIAAGALFYAYFGYPALLAAVALVRRRPRRKPGYCPSLTVLIAAYNEEASIGRKVKETLALEYPPDRLEVVVASDGSTDRTEEIVRSIEDPRVRLVVVSGRHGKTHAQNEAVKHCVGEIIVFSDATTKYHPQALRYLACNYEDPRVGAVSGRYQYFDPEGNSPTGLGSATFWNYENNIKRLQSRIATLTGCSGCIYSVRRRLYTPLPDDSCSDLTEALAIVQQGYRVVFEDRALAFEETTRSAGQEFKMRVRVAAMGIRGILSFRSLLRFRQHGWIAFQILSHKIMRWLVPVFLPVVFAASAMLAGRRAGFLALFLLQAAFYGMALFSLFVPLHRKWKLLGIPLYFCTLNAAVLVALREIFRGNAFVTWDTVRSQS